LEKDNEGQERVYEAMDETGSPDGKERRSQGRHRRRRILNTKVVNDAPFNYEEEAGVDEVQPVIKENATTRRRLIRIQKTKVPMNNDTPITPSSI